DVRDVDDRAVTNGTRRATCAARAHWERLPEGLDSRGARAIDSAEVNPLTVEAGDRGHLGLAQPDRAFADDVEYRLQVRRRSGDHAQDLAGRRLLFERLGHLAVALLEFLVALL